MGDGVSFVSFSFRIGGIFGKRFFGFFLFRLIVFEC